MNVIGKNENINVKNNNSAFLTEVCLITPPKIINQIKKNNNEKNINFVQQKKMENKLKLQNEKLIFGNDKKKAPVQTFSSPPKTPNKIVKVKLKCLLLTPQGKLLKIKLKNLNFKLGIKNVTYDKNDNNFNVKNKKTVNNNLLGIPLRKENIIKNPVEVLKEHLKNETDFKKSLKDFAIKKNKSENKKKISNGSIISKNTKSLIQKNEKNENSLKNKLKLKEEELSNEKKLEKEKIEKENNEKIEKEKNEKIEKEKKIIEKNDSEFINLEENKNLNEKKDEDKISIISKTSKNSHLSKKSRISSSTLTNKKNTKNDILDESIASDAESDRIKQLEKNLENEQEARKDVQKTLIKLAKQQELLLKNLSSQNNENIEKLNNQENYKQIISDLFREVELTSNVTNDKQFKRLVNSIKEKYPEIPSILEKNPPKFIESPQKNSSYRTSFFKDHKNAVLLK
jgi:hypothetical protein